jgi:hypothetical protein
VARWPQAPFPLPAHQTGRAVFPHPAFGQGGSHVRTRIGRRQSAEFFALVCNAVCNTPALDGGMRLIANLPASVASDFDPEPRPLPSTGITRLRLYLGPLRHLKLPGLPLADVRLRVMCPRRLGLPVLFWAPNPDMPSSLPRWDRLLGSLVGRAIPTVSLSCQQRRPSPCQCRVGSHLKLSEACSTFTRVTACLIARPPGGPLARRLRRFRYLHRLSDSFRPERTRGRGKWLPPRVPKPWHGAH